MNASTNDAAAIALDRQASICSAIVAGLCSGSKHFSDLHCDAARFLHPGESCDALDTFETDAAIRQLIRVRVVARRRENRCTVYALA